VNPRYANWLLRFVQGMAVGILFAGGCALGAKAGEVHTGLYDCTPPAETVVQHVKRVWHNLTHPHHKHTYARPVPQMCGEPEMQTVTITAGPVDDFASEDPGPLPGGAEPGYGGALGAPGTYLVHGYPVTVRPPQPVRLPVMRPPGPPTQSVPEPASLSLLLTGAAAAWAAHRRRK
jgi:hypothetical protein